MSVKTTLAHPLSEAEVAALSHYGADSTYLNAIAQQRERDFADDAQWNAFWPKSGAISNALESAIAASTLDAAATLYSAHGNGFGVRGSIRGNPSNFIGLEYFYPGFISTTAEAGFRDTFLNKRRNALSQPALLELLLPAGFNAVDLRHGNHYGEFEFLLSRKLHFHIVDAKYFDGDVLWLTLQP